MVVRTDGLSIGVAAKRIKSPDLLPRRLNEARGQLLQLGTRITHGVIALDVTFMTNPAGAVVISEHMPTGPPVAAQLTARPVNAITRTVQSWARHPDTLRLTCGVLVTASATQYTTRDGGVIQSSHVHNLILDPTSRHALARLRAAAEK
jgi:hypothetical protein